MLGYSFTLEIIVVHIVMSLEIIVQQLAISVTENIASVFQVTDILHLLLFVQDQSFPSKSLYHGVANVVSWGYGSCCAEVLTDCQYLPPEQGLVIVGKILQTLLSIYCLKGDITQKLTANEYNF